MRKIPKWFIVESAVIVFLLLALYIAHSSISIVPGSEKDILIMFFSSYFFLVAVWFISFIIILFKRKS